MASLNSDLTQPTTYGTIVLAHFAGDPTLCRDEFIVFPGYGYYSAQSLVSDSSVFKSYNLAFFGRYPGAPNVIPRGTLAVVEAEGVTHRILTYNTVIALSFREPDYRTLTLTGNITFNAQHHNPGKSVTVKIWNNSGTLSRNLAFPPSWIFLGSPGRPASIAASRTGILSITSFGTSDADVIAAWAVQA